MLDSNSINGGSVISSSNWRETITCSYKWDPNKQSSTVPIIEIAVILNSIYVWKDSIWIEWIKINFLGCENFSRFGFI